MLLEKAFSLSERITAPLLKPFPGLMDAMAIRHALSILILLIICLGAGLLGRTAPMKRLVEWLENSILQYIPGYMFWKSRGKNITGVDTGEMPVVLVRVDDGWQISFIMEQVDENMYAVFVPNSPSVSQGAVYFMEKNQIKWVEITQKQAINCIRQLGFGSAAILKDKIKTE
jgi:uncharacterized membrane protein